MKKVILYSIVFLLFFGGSSATNKTAYKPIYISNEAAQVVSFESPRDVKTQGKIYIKDQWVFIGDINLGVHVIDNSNPENPNKIGFIQIFGNHDISIKGNIMYADNFEDLVAIDFSNMQQPVITKRIEGVYTLESNRYPPNVPYGTYFECVDPSRGYVVEWEKTDIDDPKCYTTY